MNFSAISRQTVLGKLVRLPLRLVPRQAVIPILQGPLRGMKWIVGSGVHGYWLGSYEHDKQQAFLKSIKPGQVVFDIGANVGFYTLLAARAVGSTGKVVAFEPMPRNLHYLRQHVALNNLNNVEVKPVAIAAQSGQAQFSLSRHAAMNGLTEDGELAVTVSTVDIEVTTKGLVPDVLKVDVEGAELELLQGAAEILHQHHPTIFLATHGDEMRIGCIEHLKQLGYRVRTLEANTTLEQSDEFVATYL